jgi:hypothetical protein
MVEGLGWVAFLVGLVGTLLIMSERGYRDGMRIAWFTATLAIPWWFTVTFRSIGLEAVTGVALGTLIATLVRPFTGARTRWMLSDLLLGSLVLSGVISDALNRTLIPGTVLELVRTWVFPYLLGRLCFDSWEELSRTLPLIVILGTALSLFALLEAVSHINLLATLSGKKWELLEKAEGFRWGLKRAQGNTGHPIYLGLLLSLTLPWLLQAARSARAGTGPRWWIATPYCLAAAAFVTVSRSAHLAIVGVLASDQFFRKPSYRLPMFLLLLIGVVLFFIFREPVLDSLGAYAGESEVGNDKVMIYGQEYDYSGTRHRDLLLLAYEGPIERVGWFGFGTTPWTNHRFNADADPNMDIRFRSVDHLYLQLYLKYGLLGIITFLLFALSAAWNLARAAIARDGPLSDLAAGMFGSFVAVTIMIRGVALSFDFGATWLFVAGFAASLQARRQIARLAEYGASSNMTAAPPGQEPRHTAHPAARSGI